MAAGKDPRQSEKDLGAEIDRLLKKLPHADPSLSGGRVPTVAGAGDTRTPRSGLAVSSGSKPLDQKTLIAVWGRVALVGLFGLALTQWPFGRDCGWGLVWYCAAVATLLVAGGWCAMVTWEYRVGVAHILSLMLCFWGIVVSAEVLLPRLGYSVDKATWRCSSAAAASAAVVTPIAPAVIAPPPDTLAASLTDTLSGSTTAVESLPPTPPR